MTAIESILGSPAAPKWLEQLRSALADESHRRNAFRDWLTEDIKAEFINGDRVVHSPARSDHNETAERVFHLLSAWSLKRRLGRTGHEKYLVGLTRNDYEPDVCWWGPEKAITFKPETMVFPPPDLVVEVVSPSTEKYDRGVKFEDYAAHGIAEYWIVSADPACLEQYTLTGDHYDLKLKAADATLHSPLLGGIQFPIRALFEEPLHTAALAAIWQS